MAQSPTSIPTRENLLDEIGALRFEIDAANQKIQQCNNTSIVSIKYFPFVIALTSLKVVSQANELTVLRNIICRTCRHNFLDATIGSSRSPGRPLGVSFADPSFNPTLATSRTSVAAEPTLIIPQGGTTFPDSVQSMWEVQIPSYPLN